MKKAAKIDKTQSGQKDSNYEASHWLLRAVFQTFHLTLLPLPNPTT